MEPDGRHERPAVLASDHRSEEDPVAMIGSGRELPPSRHPVSAVDGNGDTARHVRRCLPGIGVRAEHLVLHLGVRERQLPWMHADDSADPSRGSVDARGLHDGFGELAGVRLVAVVLLTLQQSDDAGIAEVLGHVVGQSAERVGFLGSRSEVVGDRNNSVEHFVTHGILLGKVEWGSRRASGRGPYCSANDS